MKIAIKDIVIKNRVRKKLDGISELANNIRLYDLINPISIYTGTKELKAGMRRVLAAKSLGWSEIEFRWVDKDVEASENLYREELTPEEKVLAVEKLDEEVRGMARERQEQAIGRKQGEKKYSVVQNTTQEIGIGQKSRDIIAKDVG